jgi:calcineurin-like phosphoesterase family protein
LIWGNHDKRLRKSKAFTDLFVWCKELAEIEVEDTKVVLCHFAMRTWNKSHKGAFHLYGHSHGSLPDDPNALSFDVGVDCWGYQPVSWEQVKSKMAKKTYKPVDHHGE